MEKLSRRVFLSMPFSGESEESIKLMKEYMMVKAKEYFKKHDTKNVDCEFFWNYDCVIPEDANVLKDNESIYYLSEALKKLSTCSFAVFAPTYERAKGCRIEIQVCNDYNIPWIVA